MILDNPYVTKFKRLCADFSHLTIITKSATPGEIQVTYGHASIGSKSLRETVTAFALTGHLESLTVVSIDAEHAFSSAGKNIRLLITEVLLRATVCYLSITNNLRNCSALNAVLLPPFLANKFTI